MKKKTERRRYIFDRPDPAARQRERETAAAAVALAKASGEYSVETYKDRLAARRGPVASPEEVAASRAFNRKWRKLSDRQKGIHRCTGGCGLAFNVPTKCYFCQRRDGERAAPVLTETKKPEQVTADSLRPSPTRDALFL